MPNTETTPAQPKVWPAYPLDPKVVELAKTLLWNDASDEQQDALYKRALAAMRRNNVNV